MKDLLHFIEINPVLSVVLTLIFCTTLASLAESFSKAVRRQV